MLTFPGEVTVSQAEPQSTHRPQYCTVCLGLQIPQMSVTLDLRMLAVFSGKSRNWPVLCSVTMIVFTPEALKGVAHLFLVFGPSALDSSPPRGFSTRPPEQSPVRCPHFSSEVRIHSVRLLPE